eukprot:scaffold228_cov312-Pinguiococcus_pyrenoidosus.AAC.61
MSKAATPARGAQMQHTDNTEYGGAAVACWLLAWFTCNIGITLLNKVRRTGSSLRMCSMPADLAPSLRVIAERLRDRGLPVSMYLVYSAHAVQHRWCACAVALDGPEAEAAGRQGLEDHRWHLVPVRRQHRRRQRVPPLRLRDVQPSDGEPHPGRGAGHQRVPREAL